MRKQPKPIEVSRHAKPETRRIAWSAEPKANAITRTIRVEDKDRARAAMESAIRSDGFDPEQCEFHWTLLENGYGWTARVREGELA